MFLDEKADSPHVAAKAEPINEPYPEPYLGLGLCYLDRIKRVDAVAEMARQVYLTGKSHTGNL